MKNIILAIIFIFLSVSFALAHEEETPDANIWQIESVDTMKYSRDVAREKLKDPSYDETIEEQVKAIAESGATHIAVGTPYDEEFLPFLVRWINTARKYNLNVWFRGNFSGWEEWFDYEKITREEHIALTEKFITTHPGLFEDGDIFTTCPECENGGSGDPRHNGDRDGHRKFLIDEYNVAKRSFTKIGKKVSANYFSMNGDVAKLIMNKETTKALDGIVVIDHYVKTPEKMIEDIKYLAEYSGGKIVLGEFGNPIPDIHGKQTEEQQAEWLDETLQALALEPNVIGLNYWTLTGGSTEIADGEERRKAYETLSSYYNVFTISGHVINELNQPVKNAKITYLGREYGSSTTGDFSVPDLPIELKIKVQANSYYPQEIWLKDIDKSGLKIVLIKEKEGLIFRILKFFSSMFR